MATKHTNLGGGKLVDSGVMNNPDASRARTYAREVDRRDIKDIPCSQTARACTRTRTRVENPAAYFKAWRMAKWGGDFDPVLAAVEEAVTSFSTRNPDADRRIWLKIANRVGVNSFLNLYFEQLSIMRNCTLRSPAAAFHQRLKRFYLATRKGGAA